jgi:orotate phosphoribosyltransferase
MSLSAQSAVKLGLLRIAPADRPFPGRAGGPAVSVLADVRGAFDNIPLRVLIIEGLITKLIGHFPVAEGVVGLAKAGTPWAAVVADRTRKLAAFANLDGARASGLQRRVEGSVVGRRVVLVDNLFSSGESLRKAADIVVDAGGEVVGALTVIADPGATLEFAVHSLWSLNELIGAAFDDGRIDSQTYRRLTSKGNTT